MDGIHRFGTALALVVGSAALALTLAKPACGCKKRPKAEPPTAVAPDAGPPAPAPGPGH